MSIRVVGLIAVILFTFPAAGQEATFRADVSMVHVDTLVTDENGAAITGLERADFRVFDNGKEQPVRDLSVDAQPLDLMLLFDVSASMGVARKQVAEAARQAFGQLRPGDRVAVAAFAQRFAMRLGFTEDFSAVEKALREEVRGRLCCVTLIQTGVDEAALVFLGEKASQRRRAVIVITDDIGFRTRREATVVEHYWEADALLAGIVVDSRLRKRYKYTRWASPGALIAQAGMQGIAAKTGGETLTSEDPAEAFVEMIGRIRHRYNLYYPLPPAKTGEKRSIRVELSKEAKKRYPKAQIHARRGYFAPAQVP
jgi:VWFA-related protein